MNNSSLFAVPYKNILYADKKLESLSPLEKQELFLNVAVLYDLETDLSDKETELKNDSKIKLHDIKVQYCGYTGKLIYVIIYDHVAIEEIED